MIGDLGPDPRRERKRATSTARQEFISAVQRPRRRSQRVQQPVKLPIPIANGLLHPGIAAADLGFPTRSCVIDGELIAAGRHGQPDFLALLHGRHVPVCVYAFDLLELNGRDLREKPLVYRRARLEALLTRAKCNPIRFSEAFPDADALLAECARRGLEGIVAKRKDSPYRSGTRSG